MNTVKQHFRLFNADVSLNTIAFFLVIQLKFNCIVLRSRIKCYWGCPTASSCSNDIKLFSTGSSEFSIEMVSSPGENTYSSKTLKGCSQNYIPKLFQDGLQKITTAHMCLHSLFENKKSAQVHVGKAIAFPRNTV